jgi:trimethylamine---corrinoid protein Co-methyltransferase
MDIRKLSNLKLLSKSDMTRIHDASIKVLENTGMVFQHQKALDLFKKHGAKVENQTVYFTPKMIKDTLEKCPSSFKWRGRKDKYSVIIGKDFVVQANGGPVNIQDINNGRRLATLEDFINIQKLMQTSDVVDVVGFSPVDPSDVPDVHKHLYMQYESLKNSDKPVHGHVCGGKNAIEMLEMIEIAFGEKDLFENNHVMGLSINPLTPLNFAEDQLETLFAYAERNQIIFPAPLGIGALSGPLSHIGLTVLVNAEVLATIVLIQLINPSNPVVMGHGSTFAYMKQATFCCGTPDMNLVQITPIQMAREFYNLPVRNNCGVCEAKIVDAQAGMETMQNLMISMLAGCHLISQSLGILDGIMTTSYEKMMIDEEVIRRVKYLTRPIDVSDEALSVDVINEIGSGGSYLTHPSTFSRCRDGFVPTLSDWDSYENWRNQGSLDIVQRANRLFKERLTNASETHLDEAVDQELKAYMKRIMNN